MKRTIKLTESDLTNIVKRVISEMDDEKTNDIKTLNDLEQFLLKSKTISDIKNEIKKSVKKWSSVTDPNHDQYSNIVSTMATRDVLPILRFKDNKTKKIIVRDFLIDYIEKNYF